MDGGDRFKVTESIVEHHTFSVPEGIGIKGKDGKNYSWYGIGQSLVSIPLYLLGKFISRSFPNIESNYFTEFSVSFLNVFIGAGICTFIFIFSLLLGFSKRISFTLSILYGICTFSAVHIRDSYELQTTMFLLGAFLSLYIYSKKMNKMWLVATGIFAGMSITTRFTSSILIVPMVRFLWVKFRKEKMWNFLKALLLFVFCLVPFCIFYLYYNHLRFGSLLERGYGKICLGTYGSEIPLTNSYLKSLFGIILSPGKGLLFYSPILLLGIVSFRFFYKKDKLVANLFLMTILLYICFYAIFYFWHGSMCWGPRYLLPIVPLLLIPIGLLMETKKYRRIVTVFVVILSIIGFIIQFPAVVTNYKRYYHYADAIYKVPFEKTIFDIKYSPIIGQWKMFFQVIKKVSNGEPWKMAKCVTGFNSAQMINNSRTMNIIHFWYMQLYYMGFPIKAILLMVLPVVMLLIFSLSYIIKYIYKNRKNNAF